VKQRKIKAGSLPKNSNVSASSSATTTHQSTTRPVSPRYARHDAYWNKRGRIRRRMWITEIAEDVTELATRITVVALPERLHAIRAEMAGQPRAARYDTGGVSHQWCWTHERDVDQCQRDDLRLHRGDVRPP
jgi:hypothetical protein